MSSIISRVGSRVRPEKPLFTNAITFSPSGPEAQADGTVSKRQRVSIVTALTTIGTGAPSDNRLCWFGSSGEQAVFREEFDHEPIK